MAERPAAVLKLEVEIAVDHQPASGEYGVEPAYDYATIGQVKVTDFDVRAHWPEAATLLVNEHENIDPDDAMVSAVTGVLLRESKLFVEGSQRTTLAQVLFDHRWHQLGCACGWLNPVSWDDETSDAEWEFAEHVAEKLKAANVAAEAEVTPSKKDERTIFRCRVCGRDAIRVGRHVEHANGGQYHHEAMA